MKRFLPLSFLLLIASCSAPEPQANCYFPMSAFLEEQTYCYVNSNDTAEKSYWKMKATIAGKDTIFLTYVYAGDRLIDQMEERVANGNSELISWILYDYDSLGNQLVAECKVLSAEVFNRNQGQGESIRLKVRFNDHRSGRATELTRVRTLDNSTGNRQTYSNAFTIERLNTGERYRYSSSMVYELGKGLVSYTLVIPGQETKQFVLAENK